MKSPLVPSSPAAKMEQGRSQLMVTVALILAQVLMRAFAEDIECRPGFQQKSFSIEQPSEFIEDEPVVTLYFDDCSGNEKLTFDVSNSDFKVDSNGTLIAIKNVTDAGRAIFIHARTTSADEMAEVFIHGGKERPKSILKERFENSVFFRQKRSLVVSPLSIPEKQMPPFPKFVGKVIWPEKLEGFKFHLSGVGVDLEPKGTFKINEDTGDILVTRELDREKIASYQLQVEATDITGKRIEGPVHLDISVIDQNDNRPSFREGPYTGYILEGSPTGCDSGFGHELVKHLDARGFTVFAGFLNEDGPGAKALKEHCSSNLSTLQLDVTKPEEIRKAYFYVKSKVNARGLWGLVSNAGTVHFVCDGELIPMSDYRKTLDVNFLGAVEVFKVFCPLLRKARGRFVTVTSLAGYIPLAGTVAYNASKAAMVKFAETVKEELSIWGVKVAVVAPGGPFKTSIFHSNEELNYQAENIIKNLQPDVIEDYSTEYINYWKDAMPALKANACESFTVVINDIYHALMAEKPNYEYFPGKGAFHGKFIYRYCPGWVFNLLNPFKPKNLPLPAAIKKNLTDSRQCNS